jgi:P2 family phage contractile tail tube protein
MANIQINKISNANVYVDGVGHLGKAEEVDLPKITHKMVEHKALGMVGTFQLPTGIEPMEARIKWNSLYADILKKVANPFKAINIQIRSSQEVFTSAGRTSEVPVVCYMTATPKDFDPGKFKQHDLIETENMYNVTYLKLTIDGQEIVEFDAIANIYKADGVDLLANYRTNIGG